MTGPRRSSLVMNDSLARLITLRRSRRTKLPPWWAVALLYGLPAAFCLTFLGEGGAIFLAATTLGLLVGLPLFFFKTEASLMATLRKGRCLEEMVAAGMAPASLIDTLAVHSLIPISQVCLRVTPILLLGTLMAPTVFVKPLLLLILSWPAAVAISFACGSYLYQARSLLSETWGASSFSVGRTGGPDSGCRVHRSGLSQERCPIVCDSPGVDRLESPVYRHRRLAKSGRPGATFQGLFAKRGHRNRWIPVWSDNFIVARECARNSSLKGGLRGYLGVRFLGIVLPLILGLYVTGEGDMQSCTERFWRALPLLGLLYFCRSAGRTLGAVVHERGQKTWEILVQTGVSYREFSQGWLQMGTSHTYWIVCRCWFPSSSFPWDPHSPNCFPLPCWGFSYA